MQTLIALTITLLTLLPHSGYALTITDGYVLLPNDFHREAVFGGSDFSVVGTFLPA